jgi:hypothetical protein
MNPYPAEIEGLMKKLYQTLSEKDQRRYADIEALKLGHGGQRYIAQVLGCSTGTSLRCRVESWEDIAGILYSKRPMDFGFGRVPGVFPGNDFES